MTTIGHSSRIRGGALLVALALVGGTGCITMSVVDRVQQQQRARQLDEARERRIRQLTVAAEAGAPSAMRALAFARMIRPEPGDFGRIRSLLERAAGLGDVSAQVALADMLGSGVLPVGYRAPLPPDMVDLSRSIALLQQAAPRACRIWVTGDPEGAAYDARYNLDRAPALLAASYLQKAGRDDEARLWRARDVLHCGARNAGTFEYEAANAGTPMPRRRTALAMLTLMQGQDRERIARVERSMPADDIAAARREADDLRRRVAVSEQEFPAPTRKELP